MSILDRIATALTDQGQDTASCAECETTAVQVVTAQEPSGLQAWLWRKAGIGAQMYAWCSPCAQVHVPDLTGKVTVWRIPEPAVCLWADLDEWTISHDPEQVA